MLTTTISRITSDAESVLGPVWRETGVLARRRWIRRDGSVAGGGHG
jgi:hypothetical protein